MKAKYYLLLFLALQLVFKTYSQKVENTNYEIINDEVVVTYDLIGIIECDIKIEFISDQQEKVIPLTITGDIGARVKGGKNKKAIWNIFSDLNQFSGNFKAVVSCSNVIATPSKHFISIHTSMLASTFGMTFSPEISSPIPFGAKYTYFLNSIGLFVSYSNLNLDYRNISYKDIVETKDQMVSFGASYNLQHYAKPYLGIGIDFHSEINDFLGTYSMLFESKDRYLCFEGGTILQFNQLHIDIGLLYLANSQFLLTQLGIGYCF